MRGGLVIKMKNKKLVLASIISFLIFIFVLIEIFYGGFLVNLDLKISFLVTKIQNPIFTGLAKAMDLIFDTKSLIVVFIIISVFLFCQNHKRKSIFFVLTMLANVILLYLIKGLVARARPLNPLVVNNDFSFPSGHAASSVVFFGLLAYFVFSKSKNKDLRFFIVLVSVFIILLIGFSRIYLNVHWFSDVIGGLTLGLFILALASFINKLRIR